MITLRFLPLQDPGPRLNLYIFLHEELKVLTSYMMFVPREFCSQRVIKLSQSRVPNESPVPQESYTSQESSFPEKSVTRVLILRRVKLLKSLVTKEFCY